MVRLISVDESPTAERVEYAATLDEFSELARLWTSRVGRGIVRPLVDVAGADLLPRPGSGEGGTQ